MGPPHQASTRTPARVGNSRRKPPSAPRREGRSPLTRRPGPPAPARRASEAPDPSLQQAPAKTPGKPGRLYGGSVRHERSASEHGRAAASPHLFGTQFDELAAHAEAAGHSHGRHPGAVL